MAENARISSVEAIEAFRAKLIVFLSQAKPVLEEVGGELARTQGWLQNEQRNFWETELRRRERRLEEAKQELFNASLSKLQAGSAALQQMAVQRAQRAVREAEAKLAVLKKWSAELENRSAPLKKQVEQLQGYLGTDMTRAVTHLDQIIRSLDAYRSVTTPRSEPSVVAQPEQPEEKTS